MYKPKHFIDPPPISAPIADTTNLVIQLTGHQIILGKTPDEPIEHKLTIAHMLEIVLVEPMRPIADYDDLLHAAIDKLQEMIAANQKLQTEEVNKILDKIKTKGLH